MRDRKIESMREREKESVCVSGGEREFGALLKLEASTQRRTPHAV
jgi:hypothetical protein